MKLAVVVRARSYLRTLGPIISAGLRRKWDVRIVYPLMKLKARADRLDVDEIERHWPGVRFGGFDGADAVIALNQGLANVTVPEVPLVLVDPTFDAWLAPPQKNQVYSSAYHWAQHLNLYPTAKVDAIMAGWVNGDWTFDRDKRCIWPPSQGYAVFFSLKLRVPGRSRWFWDGMRDYRNNAEQARDVARQHGLTFVVKGRDKHNDPRWLKRLGEYVTDGDHPYESMRLLARAAWCIHYAPSGVGREAALLGVPQTVLRVPVPHLNTLPGHEERMNMLDATKWSGVVSDRLMPFTVDETKRQAWVAQYLGVQDGRAAERVLDAL